MAHSKVYIPQSTISRMLKPVKKDSVEISETSWTKIKNSNENTMEHSDEIPIHLLSAILL